LEVEAEFIAVSAAAAALASTAASRIPAKTGRPALRRFIKPVPLRRSGLAFLLIKEHEVAKNKISWRNYGSSW
jgi:hypothetical protein